MQSKESGSAANAEAIGTSIWNVLPHLNGGASAAAGSEAVAAVAGSRRQSPPESNTGGKMTRALVVGLDWLSFGGASARRGEVLAVAEGYWGEPELLERGGNFYQRQHRWACGAVLFFSDGREDCLLVCSGSVVEALPPEDQLRLLRQMHGLGFHCTRVDCKADDFARVVPLELVHAAAEAGNFVHFRRTEARRPSKFVGGAMELLGDSRLFGRRGGDGSGAFVRVYDKLLESKGEIDCIRWEVEFCSDRARLIGRMLADCDDVAALEKTIGELIGGHIDFRERGDERHVDRRVRLAWWATFLEELGCARIALVRVKSSLQSGATSFARQYRKTLAQIRVVCERTGVDFFWHLRELVLQSCSELDPRKIDARDVTLNLTEAFNLSRGPRSFVPPRM